jgi:hypothetical protein
MPNWTSMISYCFSDGVPRRSASVALIVGSLLNVVNQGDKLLASEPLNVPKILLTYAVPYLVATYVAVSVRLREESRSESRR